ncbi:glycine betaine ABC transporter substrate-binding protein [Humidisolicoccus flavus]|uniref:glycine betaine ABC transporter substrate-binding protein n=1 Tax=Humidisolicoccus flavus TaxID=3111414 RepID=UPI0032539868
MKKRSLALLAGFSAAALTLAGCSSADESGSGNGNDGAADYATVENGDKADLNIAVFNGWDEGIAASELWKAILEDKGYNVELTYADPGPVFLGLADASYDLTLDGWLPLTHASYMEEYGDSIEDLGSWNDEAVLTVAVNSDAPIDSLEELAENADLFDNRLVGIDAGAGLTKAVQENTIPGYGLEGMDFIVSSTPAMLTELQAATDAGENIAVTLWRPHWAYDAFDIKDLADPEGTLGDAEGIHSFGSENFGDEFPQLHAWLSEWKMDSETLHSLENAMFNEVETDDYTDIVAEWISENQEWVDSLTAE